MHGSSPVKCRESTKTWLGEDCKPMEPKSLKDLTGLRAEFDRCWPWLWASLCECDPPTHEKEHIWFRIYTGKAFLWPGSSCVILGEFFDHPIGFRSFHYWLQGGDLTELVGMHAGIEAWAQANGCHRAVRIGRDGWVRAMEGDWKKQASYATKWFGEPPPHVKRALQ